MLYTIKWLGYSAIWHCELLVFYAKFIIIILTEKSKRNGIMVWLSAPNKTMQINWNVNIRQRDSKAGKWKMCIVMCFFSINTDPDSKPETIHSIIYLNTKNAFVFDSRLYFGFSAIFYAFSSFFLISGICQCSFYLMQIHKKARKVREKWKETKTTTNIHHKIMNGFMRIFAN